MLTEIYRFSSPELDEDHTFTSGQQMISALNDAGSPMGASNPMQNYMPIAISRNALRVGTEETPTNALEVTLPVNVPLVRTYLAGLQELNLEIRQVVIGDSDLTIWNGRVTRLTIERNSAKFIVPTLYSHALQASVPIVRFHRTCNHVLYDDRCKVPKTPPHYYNHNLVIVESTEGSQINDNGELYTNHDSSNDPYFSIQSVNGREITLGNIPSGFDMEQLIGGAIGKSFSGMITNPNDARIIEGRSISRSTANSITLAYEFREDLTSADSIIIYKGCDHALDGDCLNTFHNCRNFGGFPLVPLDNPSIGSTN